MMRKGGGSTNNNTTILTSPPTIGLSSTTSSPSHYHSRQHHGHYHRGRGESVVQRSHSSHHRAPPTTSPSTTTTLESPRISSTILKRGNVLSSSNSDLSCGGSLSGGGIVGGGGRSPSRHQQQQHCCGCSCKSHNSSTPTNRTSLLRHVVSSNLNSPTRANSPLLLCTSPNHNHSTLRDCPVDSHPRLTTNLHPNHNNQLWLFGKDGEVDDEDEDCVIGAVGGVIDEDVDHEDRDGVVDRLNLGGSSSHGYHPSPILTLPCQGASAHYNAGAITSTPNTTNAGGFGFFKFQNSSSSPVASPPELLLPMDFIQVLIHQHAKTIVALQDLQREVSTLKDFRTSLLHSLPATGAPTAPTGLSDAVWTTGGGGTVGSSAPTAAPSSSSGATTSAPSNSKIPHPDSGFSTETKSTNQKSDAESDDELYSLLSLIQCKVQESIIRNDYVQSSRENKTGTSSNRSSTRKSDKPKERLGKLDKVLGNCDKVEFRKDFISRDVIRGVLGAEKTELQRQLFFALVKIENLKSMTKEQRTIDSRVHALSQENEQLRYKLKEMEIELEGTKATLRILQKNSYSPSPATVNLAPSSKLSSSSSSSTVLPEASSCHTNHHHHSPHVSHHQSRLLVPPPPHLTPWESDSLDNTDPAEFAIPGATTVATIDGACSHSAASTATRQRLIQKLSDIESISSSTSNPANNTRLSNYSYGSTNSNSSSKKSPAPKPPVIIEHSTTTTTTTTTTITNPISGLKQTPQQKSASPVGNKSMSSIKSNNSSIPIAVSRLKKGVASPGSTPNNNNNSTKPPAAGKIKSGGASGAGGNNGGIGTIWANWFS